MTYYLGIDHAPRYSGYALLNDKELIWYDVLDVGPESDGYESNVVELEQFILGIYNEMADANSLKSPLSGLLGSDDIHVFIEDVSHFMTKPALALRLQGALRYMMQSWFAPECVDVTMVMPSQWQRWAGWKKTPGTTSKGFSKFACRALGYEFDPSIKGKQATDLHDAVLIARYGYEKSKNDRSYG